MFDRVIDQNNLEHLWSGVNDNVVHFLYICNLGGQVGQINLNSIRRSTLHIILNKKPEGNVYIIKVTTLLWPVSQGTRSLYISFIFKTVAVY